MPFVIPGSIGLEGLTLDGLNLAQGPNGAIMLDAFTPPLFKKRVEWIEAADADGAILARDPLVSVGDAIVRVAIVGSSRDDADTIVGSIIDKLEEAERDPAGIPLVWTPANSTVSGTCYVLTGEVTELPVDWESGYMANQPTITFTLSCAPGWYGPPVTYTGSATAGPLVTLDLAAVPGDVPARGELTITDMSSQSRRTVEWGGEHLNYNPAAAWSLVLDSDSLVTSGFAGSQTTLSGAYDPGASGNSIITVTMAPSTQAICGTGPLAHVGSFRVKARINSGPSGGAAYFRFAWRVGDGSYSANDWVSIDESTQLFKEIDLGLITIPTALAGTQAWDGRVEAYSATAETMYVDYLLLFPIEAGYGKAQASYSYSPGVITGRDSFTGTTAGSNLNGRTADAGGTWATSGVATDFTFVDPAAAPLDRETIRRSTNSDASARFAILGSGTPTDVQVEQAFLVSAYPSANGEVRAGVIARWTDSSNYLRAAFIRNNTSGILTRTLEIRQIVAGVETVLATTTVAAGSILSNTWYTLRLIAFASGRVLAMVLSEDKVSVLATVEGSSSTLAGGGTLASGKSGVYDIQTSAPVTTLARYYDDFSVATPAAEPIALYSGRKLTVRYDDTLRESSAGGVWGRPPIYRGSRFWVQPAGDNARTTRLAVKASRSDLDSGEDANLTDQITLAATVTPRWSVIPSP